MLWFLWFFVRFSSRVDYLYPFLLVQRTGWLPCSISFGFCFVAVGWFDWYCSTQRFHHIQLWIILLSSWHLGFVRFLCVISMCTELWWQSIDLVMVKYLHHIYVFLLVSLHRSHARSKLGLTDPFLVIISVACIRWIKLKSKKKTIDGVCVCVYVLLNDMEMYYITRIAFWFEKPAKCVWVVLNKLTVNFAWNIANDFAQKWWCVCKWGEQRKRSACIWIVRLTFFEWVDGCVSVCLHSTANCKIQEYL